MTHLLDTNTCIAVMKGNPQVKAQMAGHPPDELAVSVITIYELFSGVERCEQPANEMLKIERLTKPIHVLPFDEAGASSAAGIRWELEQAGKVIGPYDLLIAGHAKSLNLTVVTNNTREFNRVSGLNVEDWQT